MNFERLYSLFSSFIALLFVHTGRLSSPLRVRDISKPDFVLKEGYIYFVTFFVDILTMRIDCRSSDHRKLLSLQPNVACRDY